MEKENEIIEEIQEVQEEHEYHYVLLDEEGYYQDGSWGISNTKQDGYLEVEAFPPNKDESLWIAYKYEDGEWILDENKLNQLNKDLEIAYAKQDLLTRMNDIKNQLNELDVKTMKFVDGIISKDEYEPYRLQKIDLRRQYNELEDSLNNLEGGEK